MNYNGSGGDELIIASTGAATFSSSIAATSATFSGVITGQSNGNTFGTASATGRAVIIQAGSSNQAIMFKNAAGGDGTLFINGTSTSIDYNFNTYSVGDALVIKNNGNVGIGTSSPTYKLDVYGGASGTRTDVFVSNAAANYNIGVLSDNNGFASSTNAMLFYTAANERMRITSGGNVGIGTSSPAVKFEVAGSGSIGYFRNPSSTAATTFITVVNANNTSNGLVMAHISDGTGYFGTQNSADLRLVTGDTERMRITSGGIINTTSRLNVNGAGDNSLFSFINNGTTYTLGFSPNATASTSTTLTITTATTTWIYNGTGTASWTLPNPSGTNQMFWIKNAGTGVLTLNAFSGTNIINNSATAVSSITIAVGATALIQQDGNIRSYQLQ